MNKIAIAMLCYLFFTSTACNDDTIDSIRIPENIELDLDQNGNIDFIVSYAQNKEADPIGIYQAVRMNFESIGLSQVLKHREEFPLFLEKIDQIQTEVNDPLYWEITNPSLGHSFPLARIITDYEQTAWQENWTVFASQEKESFLIAFKITEGTDIIIGYIEIAIDTQTGDFNLIKTVVL